MEHFRTTVNSVAGGLNEVLNNRAEGDTDVRGGEGAERRIQAPPTCRDVTEYHEVSLQGWRLLLTTFRFSGARRCGAGVE